LGNLETVALPIGSYLAVCQLPRGSFDVVVEHDDNHASVIMDQLLHLRVHALPLFLVSFATRGNEEFIETGIGPLRFVPRGALRIHGGQHPVASRAAAPVATAPSLLQPHIVPIAVVRFAHDIEVDTCRPGVLLVKSRSINGTSKGSICDGKVDLEI